MYEIDFTTCTINDVIVRSIVCHPSMLAEKLRATASIHFTARDAMHDAHAKAAAQRCGNQCREAANIVSDNAGPLDNAVECMTFGERMATFLAAAKLQLIPFATQHDICARDDARRAA